MRFLSLLPLGALGVPTNIVTDPIPPAGTLNVANPNDPANTALYNIINGVEPTNVFTNIPTYAPVDAPARPTYVNPFYQPPYFMGAKPTTVHHPHPLPAVQPTPVAQPVAHPITYVQPQPAIDPLMMMLLLGDSDSKMSKFLPFLMMGGQGQMDPMMMMLLLSDDDSSMSDILPFMLMQGTGGAGEMNPLMMMMLLGDDDDDDVVAAAVGDPWDVCDFTNPNIGALASAVSSPFVVDNQFRHDIATGAQWLKNDGIDSWTAFDPTDVLDAANVISAIDDGTAVLTTDIISSLQMMDPEYVNCVYRIDHPLEEEEESGIGHLMHMMHLMQPNTGGHGQQAMDPMMMMLLMSDSNSDLLPLLMAGQNNGQNGGLDPLTMLLLADDDEEHDTSYCNEKYKVPAVIYYEEDGTTGNSIVHLTTDMDEIALMVLDNTNFAYDNEFVTDYHTCLLDPEAEWKDDHDDDDDKSIFDKMLPFMLMSGGFGGQTQPGQQRIDPMMMYLLMKD